MKRHARNGPISGPAAHGSNSSRRQNTLCIYQNASNLEIHHHVQLSSTHTSLSARWLRRVPYTAASADNRTTRLADLTQQTVDRTVAVDVLHARTLRWALLRVGELSSSPSAGSRSCIRGSVAGVL